MKLETKEQLLGGNGFVWRIWKLENNIRETTVDLSKGNYRKKYTVIEIYQKELSARPLTFHRHIFTVDRATVKWIFYD